MPKKLTYEYVKGEIEDCGYSLLSKEYVNNRTKLDLICSKGHEYQASWDVFNRGHGCPHCSQNKRLTKDYLDKQFGSVGYQLLSEYKNANKRISVKCDRHHIYETSYSLFSRGYRCKECRKMSHKKVL